VNNDLSSLSNDDLLALFKKTKNNISRYNNLQLAKKVSLNSAYGALGNQYFRFFDVRQASAITYSGELSIKWMINKINEKMNLMLKTEGVDYVIAADTDSMYLRLHPIVEMKCSEYIDDTGRVIDFMDRFCKEVVEPIIESSYAALAERTHAYKQRMHMKREKLSDVAIWTAKKRYILNVWDDEGVRLSEPKISITGLEAIKSSTPSSCRDKIKEAIKLIIKHDDNSVVTKFINEYKKEYESIPLADIAFPTSVNFLDKYADQNSVWSKGTLAHTRGALMFNKLLEDMQLDHKYEKIKNGEKVKYVYLKKPNPIGTDVIAFISTLPPEFGLEPFIDYKKMFQKGFVGNLNIILHAIGWKSESFTDIKSLLRPRDG
jgi:DNA polymerase elongation subunit (family B)